MFHGVCANRSRNRILWDSGGVAITLSEEIGGNFTEHMTLKIYTLNPFFLNQELKDIIKTKNTFRIFFVWTKLSYT